MSKDEKNVKPIEFHVCDEDDEDEDEVGFKKGKVITTTEYKWTVVKTLKDGQFGAVYLVNGNNGVDAVMKVELKTRPIDYHSNSRRSNVRALMARNKGPLLKMELAVLKEMATSKHFPKIIDRGKKEKSTEHRAFYFIVMQLVGQNLHDLRKSRAQKVFSFATGLGVAHQCLESLEELHKHGYIHRDLKPQNYACGLGSEAHLIYILNFGLARKYVDSNKELKAPRDTVGFIGDVKFAPIVCHFGVERSAKDDCESWFYIFIDITNPTGIPWRRFINKWDVRSAKEKVHHGRTDNMMYEGMQHVNEIAKIFGYIVELRYQDKVDYSFIYKLLARAAKSAKVDMNAPYDWEESDTSGRTAEFISAERKAGK